MPKIVSVAIVALLAGFGVQASGAELSMSIIRPSVLDPAVGAVSGNLPGASGPKIYYLSADLKAGSLMTQLQITGHTTANRELTLALLGSDARVKSRASVSRTSDKDEVTKTFDIDSTGTYIFRITVDGEENGRYCVLFGGAALPTANGQDCSAASAAPPPARPITAAAPAVPTLNPVAESTPPVAPAPAPLASSQSGVAPELSTSMSEPTPIESLNGAIVGKTPGVTARTYYLSADVKAGLLLVQAETSGRASGKRSLDLALLGPDLRRTDWAYLSPDGATRDQFTRGWAIDSSRRAVLRLTVEGDEKGDFCVLFGGDALPSLKPPACPALTGAAAATNPDEYATTIFQPSAAESGLIAGKLPGGAGAKKFYFLSADLKAGSLLIQLQMAGRTRANREVAFTLYDANAQKKENFWLSKANDKDETTRTIEIDSSGRHFIRLAIEGEETGSFCMLLGGAALPSGGAQDCPEKTAAVAPAPITPAPPAVRVVAAPAAPPKNYEVIVTKCEERLRVRSDFLFDFDRADIVPEAESALRELAYRNDLSRRRIIIEGHTDGKGTDSYNQRLSERRAEAVRAALIDHGMFADELLVHGLGKSRPIAPNQNADGSDNPEGRQLNRRVELVVNTCS